MADAITIKLIKDGDGVEGAVLPDIAVPNTDSPSLDTAVALPNFPGMSVIGKIATTAALAKTAYDLSRAAFNRIRDIERDNQKRTETLRQYGGAGFSANTIGDRFTIFGERIPGNVSTAYKR